MILHFISQAKWQRKDGSQLYASTALMEPGLSLSSSLLIGMFSMLIFPMAKLMKTCEGLVSV